MAGNNTTTHMRRQCPFCDKSVSPQGWAKHADKHYRNKECKKKDIPDYDTLPIVSEAQKASAGVRQPLQADPGDDTTEGKKVLPIQQIVDFYNDDLAEADIEAEVKGRRIVLRKGDFEVRGPADKMITAGIANFAKVAKLLPGK